MVYIILNNKINNKERNILSITPPLLKYKKDYDFNIKFWNHKYSTDWRFLGSLSNSIDEEPIIKAPQKLDFQSNFWGAF